MAIRYQYQETKLPYNRRRKTADWIRRTAEAEGFTVGDLCIVFCSDDALLQINRQYLNHDYFTDIITFDYTDHAKKVISGDLMISIDTVRENARQFGVAFENELSRVIIHGVLHLIGYNDKGPGEEVQMHALEDKYLAIETLV